MNNDFCQECRCKPCKCDDPNKEFYTGADQIIITEPLTSDEKKSIKDKLMERINEQAKIMQELIRLIREEFEKKISQKTGWEKNEIMNAFDKALANAVIRFATKEKE